jgi:glycosyltransferase involved in cell wall biosynthesis
MKTLGICIPTYRRPEFLARCLDSIIGQMEGLPVSIYIADDACSDVNAEVIGRARERCPRIVYVRNAENLGINENIRKVIGMADTHYAWPVGEDDYFLPGALARACAALEGFDGPFMLCNYAWVGDDPAEPPRTALAIANDADISADAFVAEHLWSSGFIGACVLDVGAWRRVASDRYRGTYYAHVGHIVEMLGGRQTRVRVVARPLVANRATDRSFFTWQADALGVFLGFERMCRLAAAAVPGLAGELTQAALVYRRAQGYLTLRSLARMRAEGPVGLAFYVRECKRIQLSLAEHARILTVAMIPRTPLRLLLAGKRSLARRA